MGKRFFIAITQQTLQQHHKNLTIAHITGPFQVTRGNGLLLSK